MALSLNNPIPIIMKLNESSGKSVVDPTKQIRYLDLQRLRDEEQAARVMFISPRSNAPT
jgi:hypothetical protein